MTTNYFFTDKNDYINFLKAWKVATNMPKKEIRLRAEHFMLYNIIRGKEFDNGFTIITNRNKLENGMKINEGLFDSYFFLERVIKSAKADDKNALSRSHHQAVVDQFLAPLGDGLTVDDLKKINVPVVKPLHADYAEGAAAKEEILKGNIKNLRGLKEWLDEN